MNLLESLRNRRERRVDEHVQKAANAAAAIVCDSLLESEVGPYKIAIGEKPRGIQTEEYMDRVQDRAVKILGRHGLENMVEYDAEGSEMASASPEMQSNTLVGSLNSRCLQLVFRQPRAAA